MPTSPDYSIRRFQIDGHDLGYPTEFRDGCSSMGVFVVSASRANELIADSGFTVAEVAPGKALLSLICVHYTGSDCGAYEEIALAFFVNKAGAKWRLPYASSWLDVMRGKVASHAWRLPVTTALARDAGIQMWGFPKTLEDIDYRREAERASFCWHSGDDMVLSYSVAAKGKRQPDAFTTSVYSVYEDKHRVSYLTQSYRESSYQLHGAELRLGSHAIADELRSLGLSSRPLLAVWNGRLAFTMSAPERIYDW
jgi:hypothetical protein